MPRASAAGGLLQLPDDLLRRIFVHLQAAELRDMRLVHPQWARLAADPRLPAHHRQLELSLATRQGGRCIDLLGHPFAQQLLCHMADLNLGPSALDDFSIKRLVSCLRASGAPPLRGLCLQAQGALAGGLGALMRSANLAGLQRLELHVGTLSPAAVDALMRGPALAALEALTLSLPLWGERWLAGLGNGGRFAQIRALDLSHNSLGLCGAQHDGWVALGKLTQLQRLALEDCQIDATVLQAWSAVPAFPPLRHLDLSRNPLARDLRVFIDGDLPLSDAGLAALASCPGLSGLQSLDMGHCSLGFLGWTAFCQAARLPQLQHWGLSSTGLDAANLQVLVKVRGLPALESMDLSHTRVSSADLGRLWTAPLRQALAVVALSSGSQGLRIEQRPPPACAAPPLARRATV